MPHTWFTHEVPKLIAKCAWVIGTLNPKVRQYFSTAQYVQGIVLLLSKLAPTIPACLTSFPPVRCRVAHSYMHLGMALHQLTDFENAIAAYDKAVSLEPQEPLLHLNYGEMG
jgi:tetratricopeptide (TPR) repeat protein